MVLDNVEYYTSDDFKANDKIIQMMDSMKDKISKEPQREKFFIEFISNALKHGGIKSSVFQCMMEQDFFVIVSPAALEYCNELLYENADAGWYGLIHTAFREKENPIGFSREIVHAFKNGISFEDVQNYFTDSTNVFLMKAARDNILKNRGYENHGVAIADLCADAERIINQLAIDCNEYKACNEKVDVVLKEQSMKIPKLHEQSFGSDAQLRNAKTRVSELSSENARLRVDNKKLSGKVDSLQKIEKILRIQTAKAKEREGILIEKNNMLEKATRQETAIPTHLNPQINGQHEDGQAAEDTLKERCSLFAKLYRMKQMKKFSKLPKTQQKDEIFTMLMQLQPDKEQIASVKKAIAAGAEEEILYEMLLYNRKQEEFRDFCNRIASRRPDDSEVGSGTESAGGTIA